jgi:hypothetical protein
MVSGSALLVLYPGVMAAPPLRVGLRVQLHSLTGRRDMNGSLGQLVSFDANTGRWATAIVGSADKTPLLVAPDNLLVCFVDMALLARFRTAEERRMQHDLALKQVRDWEQRSERVAEATINVRPDDDRVFVIDGVLDAAECDSIISATLEAAEWRGWSRLRHGSYPTTDLPLSCIGECQGWVRSTLFRQVCRPLASKFVPSDAALLDEHLVLHDLFVVKYSVARGHQCELETHTDGSDFSFNVLLSDPSAFDGGGTSFEATGQTVHLSRGSAVGHSGQVRHAGVAITRGERFVLVGFVGFTPESTYTSDAVDKASRDAFVKFGDGAWDRSAFDPPLLVSECESMS